MRIALFSAVFAIACAPGLSNPERFETDGSVCPLDIQQDLLIPRCGRGGCHTPFDMAGGLEVISADLGSRMINAPSTVCGGRVLIDPAADRLDQSWLLVSLGAQPQCDGNDVMREPFASAPLTEDELACLREWADHEAEESRR